MLYSSDVRVVAFEGFCKICGVFEQTIRQILEECPILNSTNLHLEDIINLMIFNLGVI